MAGQRWLRSPSWEDRLWASYLSREITVRTRRLAGLVCLLGGFGAGSLLAWAALRFHSHWGNAPDETVPPWIVWMGVGAVAAAALVSALVLATSPVRPAEDDGLPDWGGKTLRFELLALAGWLGALRIAIGASPQSSLRGGASWIAVLVPAVPLVVSAFARWQRRHAPPAAAAGRARSGAPYRALNLPPRGHVPAHGRFSLTKTRKPGDSVPERR